MIAVVNQEARAEGHSVDQSTLIKVWFQFSSYIETLRFSLTSCSCLLEFYRPQTKFTKVMFLHVSVCPHGGRAWLLQGGHAWLLPGGGWVCVVFSGGHEWFFSGACMIFSRGACVVFSGGHAWFFPGGGGMHRIQRDMVNERAVRILLECILVSYKMQSWVGVTEGQSLIIHCKHTCFDLQKHLP